MGLLSGIWSRKAVEAEPLPWVEESLQRMHSVVLEIERRQSSLEHGVSLMSEGVMAAKQVEKRIGAAEIAIRQLASSLAEDVSRLTGALESVRGYATGSRGGRPRNEEREAERQATELGQRMIRALATPEGRLALIQELQSAGSYMGPVGPVGPVGNGSGSPV